MEFDCSFCGESFDLFCDRKKHIKEEHDHYLPNVMEYQCMICGQPYGSHSDMMKCFDSHPEEKKRKVETLTDDLI